MGLGYPRGGRGRGGFQNSNDFNQGPPPNENLVPTVTAEGSEKVPATTPITAQSGNNVQVVTTPAASTQQPSQQQGQLQQQSSAPIQSNVPMNNPPPSRGHHRMDRGGRGGFGSRGSFGGRGRGSFGQNLPPPRQFDTRQPSNLTQTLPPKMNRYDQQGSMQPPKRGRYDSGPYMGNRNITPNQPPPMASQHHHQQGSYNSMPP
jgi:hypothetical protein